MKKSEYDLYDQRLYEIFTTKSNPHTFNEGYDPKLALQAQNLRLRLQAFKAKYGLDEDTTQLRRVQLFSNDSGYAIAVAKEIFEKSSHPVNIGNSLNPSLALAAFDSIMLHEEHEKLVGPVEGPTIQTKQPKPSVPFQRSSAPA